MELSCEVCRYTDAAKAAKNVEALASDHILKSAPTPEMQGVQTAKNPVQDPFMALWCH